MRPWHWLRALRSDAGPADSGSELSDGTPAGRLGLVATKSPRASRFKFSSLAKRAPRRRGEMLITRNLLDRTVTADADSLASSVTVL